MICGAAGGSRWLLSWWSAEQSCPASVRWLSVVKFRRVVGRMVVYAAEPVAVLWTAGPLVLRWLLRGQTGNPVTDWPPRLATHTSVPSEEMAFGWLNP